MQEWWEASERGATERGGRSQRSKDFSLVFEEENIEVECFTYCDEWSCKIPGIFKVGNLGMGISWNAQELAEINKNILEFAKSQVVLWHKIYTLNINIKTSENDQV